MLVLDGKKITTTMILGMLSAFATASASAQEVARTLEFPAPAKAGTVVRIPVTLPKAWSEKQTAAVRVGADQTVGQFLPASVTRTIQAGDGEIVRDLVFLLPKDSKGASAKLTISPSTTNPSAAFAWKEGDGWTELSRLDGAGSRPVLRYMHAKYDTSSKDARNKTYKVFHHVYDPAGTRFVTNGGHTDPFKNEKDLKFPHHRGLMFAFNRISYGAKKTADTWHCTNDAHLSDRGTTYAVVGPIAGEHRVVVGWHGVKGEMFAEEDRQMTIYAVPGGTLIEFATKLRSLMGKIKLDGDPQHAGFQFRAHNDVASKESSAQTYYLRPDGKDKPGATRNWEPKTKKGPVDLPWYAMSFVLGGKRYTAEYIDHPNNPGEKRYSERDYGRFGCYFPYDLTPDHPLVLNHRVWLQDGEMTAEQAIALRDAFVNAPKVK